MTSNSCQLVLLVEALAFAARKHHGQTRKDAAGTPYLYHPIEVARVLAVEAGVDEVATLQAALLHDTLEDTQTTQEELVRHFGLEVAGLVAEVTDDPSLPSAERKRVQRQQAPSKSARAALIRAADKTCNLRDVVARPPHDWSLERKQQYFDWAKSVVDALPPLPPRLRASFDAAFASRPQ